MKHNLPAQFRGLQGLIQEIFSRLESLERRPRTGIERLTIATDTVLDPITRYVWVNAAANITVTLPDQWDGAIVTFKNVTANTVTIATLTGTVDGGSTASFFGLNTVRTFQSDGTNWITL